MLSAILELIAGIALFIYAMSMTEHALREMAGRQFKLFLQKNINSTLKSIGAGTIVTGILQSSSVVALMTLSFVGAGLINMRNALAITLGTNLGTTLDSWIIAAIGFRFDLLHIAFPQIIIAVALRMIYPTLKFMNHLSGFLIGFAFLFVGLEWMKESAEFFVQIIDIQIIRSYNAYWFVLFGFMATAIVQSSSAMTAITLTALYHQLIPFENAIGVIIGSQAGNVIKVYLGSLGGIPDKKRVALGNIYYNLCLLVLSSILLYPIAGFFDKYMLKLDPLLALVSFQTGINLIMIVVFYPFVNTIANILENRYTKETEIRLTKFIQHAQAPFTDDAFTFVKKEIHHFLNLTIEFHQLILGIAENTKEISWLEKQKKRAELKQTYLNIKELQGLILEYLVELRTYKNKPREIEIIGKYIDLTRHVMHAAKKIKDIDHNVQELEQTADEVLYTMLLQIQMEERVFIQNIKNIQEDNSVSNLHQEIQMLTIKNDQYYNQAINYVLNELDKGNIKEIDSSTLLNIYRALHTSHQSILDTIELLHIQSNHQAI